MLLLKPYDEFASHMYQTVDTDHNGLLSVKEIEEEFRQYDVNRKYIDLRYVPCNVLNV